MPEPSEEEVEEIARVIQQAYDEYDADALLGFADYVASAVLSSPYMQRMRERIRCLEEMKQRMTKIERELGIDYGIDAAVHAERGSATTSTSAAIAQSRDGGEIDSEAPST